MGISKKRLYSMTIRLIENIHIKKIIFLCLLFILHNYFITSAISVPALGKYSEYTQSDSEKIMLRQRGDENNKYFEDIDGYIVVRDGSTFKYASINAAGEIKPSQDEVSRTRKGNSKNHIKLSDKKILKKIKKKVHSEFTIYDALKKQMKNERNSATNRQNKKSFRLKKTNKNFEKTAVKPFEISGQKEIEEEALILKYKQSTTSKEYSIIDPVEKVLVIFIDFADKLNSVQPGDFSPKIFSAADGSLKNYIYRNSYGNLLIDGRLETEKIYRSSRTSDYYGEDSDNSIDDKNAIISELVSEAVTLADTDIDFSKYDGNGDGIVDHLIIVHSGQDQAFTGNQNDIWSHRWLLPENGKQADGVTIKNYILVSEFSPLGVIAHEFFHDLGAPDLYDYDFDDFPAGEFCVMSYGVWLNDGNTPSNLCGYLKMDLDADPANGYLGWIAPVEFDKQSGTVNISLIPLDSWSDTDGGQRLARINTARDSEYFLLAYRKKQAYDLFLPDEGMLVWHIDESMPDGEGALNSGRPLNSFPRIELKTSSLNDFFKSDAAFCSEDEQTVISPFTENANTNLNNGGYSNIIISNVSDCGSNISCDLSYSIGPVEISENKIISESDGNGYLQESETGLIQIKYKNSGISLIKNCVLNIIPQCDYITVLNPEIIIGDISAAAENQILESISVKVNEHIFGSGNTIFKAVFRDSDGNIWNDTFSVFIQRKFNCESVTAADTDKIILVFTGQVEFQTAENPDHYKILKASDLSRISINNVDISDDSRIITVTANTCLSYSETYLIVFPYITDIYNSIPADTSGSRVFISLSEQDFFAGHISVHQLEKELYKDYSPALPPFQRVTPLNEAKSQPRVTKIIYGYYPYWISSPTIDWEMIHTLSFFSFDADAQGNLTNVHGWPNIAWVSTAHSKGVRVEVTCALFGTTSISTLLNSQTYRTTLINNIISQIIAGRAEGVCIDFEFVTTTVKDKFTLFLQELRAALDVVNPAFTLSIAGPAVPSWYPGYDYNKIAETCDFIFIMAYDYHYSGGQPGPVAPLGPSSRWGTSLNDSATINGYLAYSGVSGDSLLMGIPYYGYDWPTVDYTIPGAKRASATARIYKYAVYTYAKTYGRYWDTPSNTPYVLYGAPSDTRQLWYDDTQSISMKYDLFKSKSLRGTGMWAIGSDGTYPELWDLIDEKYGPPTRPKLHYAKNKGSGSIELRWSDPPESDLSKIYVYRSTDGKNYTLIDNNVNKAVYTKTVSSLNPGQLYYFYVSAIDTAGNESRPSDKFAVLVTNSQPSVLVVYDDARYVNSAYSDYFAEPLLTAGPFAFDYCDSISVTSGLVSLDSYSTVIWYTGRDSNGSGGTGTLNSSEQTKLINFLKQSGKRLFISGQELAYDLDYSNNGRSFINKFLGASYTADDAGSPLTLSGTAGSIFDGLSFMIDPQDDGLDSGGAYDATYPDVISAQSGCTVCLKYNGTSNAAVYYSSPADTKIVYLAFPFETIATSTARKDLITRIMNFFSVSNSTEDSTPPSSPVLLGLTNTGVSGQISLRWKNPDNSDLHHLNIYISSNNSSFTLVDTSAASTLVKIMNGLSNNIKYYFYITLTDNSGNEGSGSDTYMIRTIASLSNTAIIEDDNRYGNHGNAVFYGDALDSGGYAFDCVASEAITGNTYSMINYSIIIWFTGRDSNNGFNSLSQTEQAKVQNFLDSGGKLFISGQEIAYELDYKNYGDTFYKNYLKAVYSADDAGNSLTVSGVAGGIFNGISFGIDADNGVNDGGAYDANYPDSIAANGGTLCLRYSSVYGAAVNYSGTYKLINFAFPFECITTAASRKSVIEKIMDFFGQVAADTKPDITILPLTYSFTQGTSFNIPLTASDNFDSSTGLSWQMSDTDPAFWQTITITEGITDTAYFTPKLTAVGSDTITIKVIDSSGNIDTALIVISFISTSIPDTPVLKYVKNNGTGNSVDIAFYADTSGYKYYIYKSTDGVNYSISDTVYAPLTSTTVSGLANNTLYFFKIKIANSIDSTSIFSDIYSVRTTTSSAKVIVIEDDNRYGPNDYIINYARVLNSLSRSFNSGAAECVVDGEIRLDDYDIVIWFCAKDSNLGKNTFGTIEQEKIIEYLDNGGNFFVSGNEIGYELDYMNYGRFFYNSYLRADFGYDDSYRYTLKSTANTIFGGLADFYIYTDDTGSVQGSAAYQAKWPDRFGFYLDKYNGSSVSLKYYNSGWGAAVDYSGGFGVNYSGEEKSEIPAKVVTFAFAYECINDTTARVNVMQKILNFFDSSTVCGKVKLTGDTDNGGATVNLVKYDYSGTTTVVSDDAGRFRFDFVDSGRYFISVQKNGFVSDVTQYFNVSNLNSDTFVNMILYRPVSCNITYPIDYGNTAVRIINVSGTALNTAIGDAVMIYVNNVLQSTEYISEADENWSGTAALSGISDSISVLVYSGNSVCSDIINFSFIDTANINVAVTVEVLDTGIGYNGGVMDIAPGVKIRYIITVLNPGSDTLANIFVKSYPVRFSSFVSGSIEVDTGGGYTACSDSDDGDNADYNISSPNIITALINALSPSATARIRYCVIIE